MARNPKQPVAPTRKHLARQERERRQTRMILIGTGIVIGLVLLVLLYGLLDRTVISANRAVVTVNGDKVSAKQFEGQVRFAKFNLINSAMSTAQFMQLFGSDPSTMASFASQLQQIQMQMSASTVGQQVIDQMVEDRLIRQEASRRGINITAADVDAGMQEAFGYFANGTPTPEPTLETLFTPTTSALQITAQAQLTAAVPTATAEITSTAEAGATGTPEAPAATEAVEATATPEVTEAPAAGDATPTATTAPTATATPYTLEGFQQLFQDSLENFNTNYGITEADLRFVIESGLYQKKVMDAVLAEQDITRTEEQVWAWHILVADEQAAKDVVARLEAGEEWCALAAELSTDTSNASQCGDLQWFNRERMVTAFSDAAFSTPVGEISAPVQTDFGWHIIKVLGHNDQPLTDDEYTTARQTAFTEWLASQRETATIETYDNWVELVPAEPTMPAEIDELINQAMQQQSAPATTTP